MLSFDLKDIHRTAGNAVCQIVALWDMSSKLDIEARCAWVSVHIDPLLESFAIHVTIAKSVLDRVSLES